MIPRLTVRCAVGVAAVALAVLLLSSVALALMPPHTRSSVPPDGGELQGRIIIFHGYSLTYAERRADASDLETRRPVQATVEVSCVPEGQGSCPGCVQQKCQARVTLAAVVRDHRYRVKYHDRTITVKAMVNEAGEASKDGNRR